MSEKNFYYINTSSNKRGFFKHILQDYELQLQSGAEVSLSTYQSQVSSLQTDLPRLITHALLYMVGTAEEIKAFIALFVIKGIGKNKVNNMTRNSSIIIMVCKKDFVMQSLGYQRNNLYLLNMYEDLNRQFSVIYLPTAYYHYIFLDKERSMNYGDSWLCYQALLYLDNSCLMVCSLEVMPDKFPHQT